MAKTHELVDTTRTHAIGGKVFMEIPGQMDEPAEDSGVAWSGWAHFDHGGFQGGGDDRQGQRNNGRASERLTVPTFSGEDTEDVGSSARSYLRQVEAWRRMAYLPPAQQGLVLYQNLSGKAWIASEELSVPRLGAEGGVGYFISWINARFLDLEVARIGKAFSDFFRRLKRRPGQTITGSTTPSTIVYMLDYVKLDAVCPRSVLHGRTLTGCSWKRPKNSIYLLVSVMSTTCIDSNKLLYYMIVDTESLGKQPGPESHILPTSPMRSELEDGVPEEVAIAYATYQSAKDRYRDQMKTRGYQGDRGQPHPFKIFYDKKLTPEVKELLTQVLSEANRLGLVVRRSWTVEEIKATMEHWMNDPAYQQADGLGIQYPEKITKGNLLRLIRDAVSTPDSELMKIGKYKGYEFQEILQQYGMWAACEIRMSQNPHVELVRYAKWWEEKEYQKHYGKGDSFEANAAAPFPENEMSKSAADTDLPIDPAGKRGISSSDYDPEVINAMESEIDPKDTHELHEHSEDKAFITTREFEIAAKSQSTSFECTRATATREHGFTIAYKNQDYDYKTLLILLNTLDYNPVKATRDGVFGGKTGDPVNYFTYGIFSHGGVVGVTTKTHECDNVVRYLNGFARHHLGPKATWTSVSVSHNTATELHHDYHNCRGGAESERVWRDPGTGAACRLCRKQNAMSVAGVIRENKDGVPRRSGESATFDEYEEQCLLFEQSVEYYKIHGTVRPKLLSEPQGPAKRSVVGRKPNWMSFPGGVNLLLSTLRASLGRPQVLELADFLTKYFKQTRRRNQESMPDYITRKCETYLRAQQTSSRRQGNREYQRNIEGTQLQPPREPGVKMINDAGEDKVQYFVFGAYALEHMNGMTVRTQQLPKCSQYLNSYIKHKSREQEKMDVSCREHQQQHAPFTVM
ncbi:unnamed protein product [Symbiodinium microadriaticum]|nr:unnamed protein product [Symbiodinium microadriaticum]